MVICTWVKHGWLDFHGGKKLSDEKIYVTESGKNLDCGLSLWGGECGARIFHPLYTRMQGVDEDGVSVIRPTNKLDILDELKARFEAGEWDDYRNPGRSYLGNRPGCGFPHQYFDYYSEVKDIDMVDRGRRD